MGNKFLIRSYNVGLGDCFYLQIPDGGTHFHALIDCGSKGSANKLKAALDDIKTMLPTNSTGKKVLDLVVATHRHEDHIKGFDPDFFDGIQIKNIWMTAMMDPNHSQANKAQSLDQMAKGMVAALDANTLALNPELALVHDLFGIGNDGAETALRDILPARNGIEPKYVVAGNTAASLGIALKNTKITVLGPEKDIDRFYLGKSADPLIQGLESFKTTVQPALINNRTDRPANISITDFQKLKSRVIHDVFAFANEASEVVNNSSVVLLIEWKTKRLLFVGDAEWHDHYEEGKKNGAWNVMWNQRKTLLNKPLDFLKIGHHGSFNATPLNLNEGPQEEVNVLLNAILPKPKAGKKAKAKAIVSTERTIYKSIPQLALLGELSTRIGNSKTYKTAFEQSDISTDQLPNFDLELEQFGKPQPLRTDFEFALTGIPFVNVEL